jgi:hypothetical protein
MRGVLRTWREWFEVSTTFAEASKALQLAGNVLVMEHECVGAVFSCGMLLVSLVVSNNLCFPLAITVVSKPKLPSWHVAAHQTNDKVQNSCKTKEQPSCIANEEIPFAKLLLPGLLQQPTKKSFRLTLKE